MRIISSFILAIIALWFLWFFTGGPYNGNTEGPYMKPVPPVGTGETYW